MTEPRYSADDAREWLRRARSALVMAQSAARGVDFEDLCYAAEQAAEKAIKAVFVHRKQAFPFTHNLDRLLNLLDKEGVILSSDVLQAGALTPFALETRYPGVTAAATEEDYREALVIATAVIRWAEAMIWTAEHPSSRETSGDV